MKGTFVTLAVVVAACGGGGGYAKPAQPQPQAGTQSEGGAKAQTAQATDSTKQTTVRVQNESIDDMDVYVLGSGSRVRLGTVRGNSTEVLTIPDDIVRISQQVRFLLHPIGGRNERTETIGVMPGDQVQMTIPPS